MLRVFLGQIVHTKSLNEFEVFANGFLAVDKKNITAIGSESEYSRWRANHTEHEEVRLSSTQFLMPGFVDCHIHAPQVAQIGLGLDMELLDWLNAYTFPLEAKFADKEFALTVYRNVVNTTLRNGTTLASYFGTNHKDSTIILAQEALRQGQRAFVGKVCSNCNSPDFYVETLEEAVRETDDYLKEFEKLQSELVQPTITPRFAVSCNAELLSKLGAIAKSKDLNIQSHVSESLSEIEFMKVLYKGKSYTQVYKDADLMTKKTIMAHAVHLEDEELAIFKETGASVAHCPASNTNLSSGFCDVKRILDAGVSVGLGTDVSGGNSMSIKSEILNALNVSHHLEFVKKQDIKGTGKLPSTTPSTYTPLTYKQAIFLATLGGAEALAVGNLTGNFEVGKEFDALVVDTSVYPLEYLDLGKVLGKERTPEERLLELVQKFIYVGDDRNISEVFVAGKKVK